MARWYPKHTPHNEEPDRSYNPEEDEARFDDAAELRAQARRERQL